MDRITDGFRGASMFASSETAKYYNALCDLEDKIERGEMVAVVRCRECRHAKPIPERAAHAFTDKAMMCEWQRGDWSMTEGFSLVAEDGFCDEGECKEETT